MTRLFKVDPQDPDQTVIKLAAEVILQGGLVAFPTETVYGLGANAFDEQAVVKIFQAKRRPMDNPLIVHIADIRDLDLVAEEVPLEAEKSIRRFWPGPLTLVLPKSDLVPEVVTARLPSVAVRMPSHPVAFKLISSVGIPIAAPSANLAGRPSPTRAQHVIEDLWSRVDVILDGGETTYGIESTVLDLTCDTPTILRPGPVTLEELKEVLERVDVHPIAKVEKVVEEVVAKSPGLKYRHYAPRARLILVEGDVSQIPSKVNELYLNQKSLGRKVRILATQETLHSYGVEEVKVLGSRVEPRSIARNLFKLLRECDGEDVDVIITEGVEPLGVGLAIMNRLRKASSSIFRVGQPSASCRNPLNTNFLK